MDAIWSATTPRPRRPGSRPRGRSRRPGCASSRCTGRRRPGSPAAPRRRGCRRGRGGRRRRPAAPPGVASSLARPHLPRGAVQSKRAAGGAAPGSRRSGPLRLLGAASASPATKSSCARSRSASSGSMLLPSSTARSSPSVTCMAASSGMNRAASTPTSSAMTSCSSPTWSVGSSSSGSATRRPTPASATLSGAGSPMGARPGVGRGLGVRPLLLPHLGLLAGDALVHGVALRLSAGVRCSPASGSSSGGGETLVQDVVGGGVEEHVLLTGLPRLVGEELVAAGGAFGARGSRCCRSCSCSASVPPAPVGRTGRLGRRVRRRTRAVAGRPAGSGARARRGWTRRARPRRTGRRPARDGPLSRRGTPLLRCCVAGRGAPRPARRALPARRVRLAHGDGAVQTSHGGAGEGHELGTYRSTIWGQSVSSARWASACRAAIAAWAWYSPSRSRASAVWRISTPSAIASPSQRADPARPAG